MVVSQPISSPYFRLVQTKLRQDTIKMRAGWWDFITPEEAYYLRSRAEELAKGNHCHLAKSVERKASALFSPWSSYFSIALSACPAWLKGESGRCTGGIHHICRLWICHMGTVPKRLLLEDLPTEKWRSAIRKFQGFAFSVYPFRGNMGIRLRQSFTLCYSVT